MSNPVNASAASAPGLSFTSVSNDISTQITYVPNRDSVTLFFPTVSGAKDYRVYAVENGVKTLIAGETEDVQGATIYCAGIEQSNDCAQDDVHSAADLTGLNPGETCSSFPDVATKCSPLSDVQSIYTDRVYKPTLPRLMRQLEVANISPNGTTLVVEAIDRQCPFAGTLVSDWHAAEYAATPQATNDLNTYSIAARNARPGSSQEEYLLPGEIAIPVDQGSSAVNGLFMLSCSSGPRRGLSLLNKLRTENVIRNRYGSLIINGQGMRVDSPLDIRAHTTELGLPADPVSPKVLARGIISVQSASTALPPAEFADPSDFTKVASNAFWEDFSNSADQPKFVAKGYTAFTDPRAAGKMIASPGDTYLPTQGDVFYQNSKMNFYSSSAGFMLYDFNISRGQLRTVLGDEFQGNDASVFFSPRKLAHLPALGSDKYLHITFETNFNATMRRYAHVILCGDSKVGTTTMPSNDPYLPESIRYPMGFAAFFQEKGGPTISRAGWNCFQLISRDGTESYGWMSADPIQNQAGYYNFTTKEIISPAEYSRLSPAAQANFISFDDPTVGAASSTKVNGKDVHHLPFTANTGLIPMINRARPDTMSRATWVSNNLDTKPLLVGFDQQEVSNHGATPQNVEFDGWGGAWLRHMDFTQGNKVTGRVLDDQQSVHNKAKFDLYVNRERSVVFINGEQRLCNGFGQEKLTMAEAAVGFTDISYHTASEHMNIAQLYSSQRQYRFNTPWADNRVWDNIGFVENVSLPAGYNPNECFNPNPNVSIMNSMYGISDTDPVWSKP